MAFTPEDGTGVALANSYVSVAYADAYHLDRGNAAWAGAATPTKQAALVKATDYLEQNYATRWTGEAVYDSQGLSWPRDSETGMPTSLQAATCLLALEAISGDLNPALGQAVKSKKVDVVEIVYQDRSTTQKKRPAIEGLLRRLLTGGAFNVPVVRV